MLGDGLDGFALRRARLRLFVSGVAALGGRSQGLAGTGAGGFEIEGRTGAESVRSAAHDPAARPGRKHPFRVSGQ